jgi:putative membrane protein
MQNKMECKQPGANTSDLEQRYKPLVIGLSIVIPIAIAVLFKVQLEGYDLSGLPPIYASCNALTAVLLIAAVIAIKRGKRDLHRNLIICAMAFSVAFLGMYVAYHMTSASTIFGDTDHNGARSPEEAAAVGKTLFAYTALLLSHILLSMIVLPIVMTTFLKGMAGNFVSHKKWARVCFPIWLFVATSGVIVFLMIRPYYA